MQDQDEQNNKKRNFNLGVIVDLDGAIILVKLHGKQEIWDSDPGPGKHFFS